MADDPTKVTRVKVNFNYTGLNWDFLKLMAEIVPYADEKYTSFAQYTHERLEGEKSPENHMAEHLRQYMMDEPYDHFDGDRGRHLVAIAYNAMMEWYYLKKFGPKTHPLKQGQVGQPLPKRTQPGEVEATLTRNLTGAAAVRAETEAIVKEQSEIVTDWAAGFSHFLLRWTDGLDGAREPNAILKWKAMLWVIEQFTEVKLTDDIVLPMIDELKAAMKEKLAALATVENISECSAKIAALDTLRIQIPQQFRRKADSP